MIGKIIFIIWIFLCLSFLGFIIYKNYFDQEIPCLEEIARDYCESEGFSLGVTFWNLRRRQFSCKRDLRIDDSFHFNFLEEEIEWCKK